MLKSKNVARDVIFFILLLAMSKKIIERTWTHIKKDMRSAREKMEVHELDKSFLVSVKETKKQINQAIEISHMSDVHRKTLQQLQKMKTELKDIESKFKHNSPATFLLGPLGTTAIVLKEKKLEKQLINIMEQLGSILYAFQDIKEKKMIEVASIEQGLAQNKHLISYIT